MYRKPDYRPDIDGLRGFAVLSVIGYHLFPELVPGGFFGVDIFFVISGFLINSIILSNLKANSFDLVEFYVHRINRIFPALILVLSACFFAGWFLFLAVEFKNLAKHIVGAALFLSNLISFREVDYFGNFAHSKPLLHLWSLGVEEQFYLLWPALMILIWRLKLHIPLVTAALVLVSFTFGIITLNNSASAAFYFPHTRFWEILVGGLLATLSQRRIGEPGSQDRRIGGVSDRLENIKGMLGIGLIFTPIFFLSSNVSVPGWWTIPPVVGSALIISADGRSVLVRAVLSGKHAVWFGLISYSLYLWHWPIFIFASTTGQWSPNFAAKLGILAGSIRPIRLSGARRERATALLCMMLVVGLAGGVTYRADGVGDRSAGRLLSIQSFQTPYIEKCDSITGESYSADYCHLSESSDGDKILLLGDSHANAFSTVLSALRSEFGFSFIQLGRGGCPSLINYGHQGCLDISKQALQIIEERKSIQTVVLAARWSSYDQDRPSGTSVMRSADYRKALEKTLQFLFDKGKNVVLVMQVPEGRDPLRCVVRPLSVGSLDLCPRDAKHLAESQDGYRAFIFSLKSAFPKLKIYDPWHYLCEGGVCVVIENGNSFYSDESHLSLFGGRYLAEKSKSELIKLLELHR